MVLSMPNFIGTPYSNIKELLMPINVRKDMTFFLFLFLIIGRGAFAQIEQNRCLLKIFVNDPYAQIFVDGSSVGSPPKIIPCSDREKNIIVRSSDGQIFSRLMTSKNNFDLANSTLNVVFHKKMSDVVYRPEGEIWNPTQEVSVVAPSRDLGSTPLKQTEVSTPPSEIQLKQSAPIVTKLPGSYVQIFALKNLDLSKIEQDINIQYNGKITQQEITVCPWQSSKDSQILSLVLVGPFSKSSALAARNHIGGKSFIVTDPRCTGDYTKVSR